MGELLPDDVLVEIREEDLESVETMQKLFKEKIAVQPPRIDVIAQPKNRGVIAGVVLAALLVVAFVAYRILRPKSQSGHALPIRSLQLSAS